MTETERQCLTCGAQLGKRQPSYCSRVCSNRGTGPKLAARVREDGPRPIAWACGGGVEATCVAKALLLRDGGYAYTKDQKASNAILDESCGRGNMHACYLRAMAYQNGWGTVADKGQPVTSIFG